MSSVYVQKNVDVDIKLSNTERDVLIRAYKILCDVSRDMWNDDADETETFNRVYGTKECLQDFLRRDIGIELDNKGEVVSVN